jgi:threonine/homoserine/homoserine lactone efflux protein
MDADTQSDRDVTVVDTLADKPKPEPAWGAIIVMAGLLAIVVIFVVSVLSFDRASDVATATSGVTGVIATLVGAYFGVRGATLATKQAAEQQETRDRRAAGK